MIRVNLIPIEERGRAPHPAFARPRRGFVVTVLAAAAILVPLGGMTAMQRVKIASLKGDIAAAEAESRKLQPQIEKIRLLQQQRNDVQQRLVTLQMLTRDRYLPVQVMDELATETPEHLWFTKFHEKPNGELELEGMTFSNVLVSELMSRLEEADIFEEVTLAVSERGKTADPRVMHFVLTAKIKP